MSTKREDILAAVRTALTGTAGVSTRIYRSRSEAFSLAEHPAIVVEPISDVCTRANTSRIQWELIFSVIVLVRDEIPDSAGDTIVSSAHNKIMTDASLQALVMDVLPVSTSWNILEADESLGIISMQFKIMYQTSENDLTSL